MKTVIHSGDIGDLKSGFALTAKSFINKKNIINTEFKGNISDESFVEHNFTENDDFLFIKTKDRDFTVLNFTDPHFADYDVRTLMAIPATSTMRKLVSAVKPDLITVTGDIICSDSGIFSIKRFCNLMESFGTPWAPIFGNHDNETNCDLDFISDIFLKCPNCIFKKGDPEMGRGNYIINIAEKNENGNNSIVQSFIMMYHKDGCPNEKQLKWYKWASNGIKEISNDKARVALMLHIPLPEYQYAVDEFYDSSLKKWKNDADACGEIHEEVCCERHDGQPYNRGFFELIKASGNTDQVLCGHEHLNDFSVVYRGIRLTYMLKVGKGSGGGFGLNGGTVISVGSSGINRITHKAVHGLRIIDKEDIIIK